MSDALGKQAKERRARGVRFPLRSGAAIFLSLLAACVTRPPLPPAPAAAPPPDTAPTVTLTWSGLIDLDLYVTGRYGESLYVGDHPTQAGVRLTGDANCAALAGGAPKVEQARLTALRPGRYMVGIDFVDSCGSGYDIAPFRVTIDGIGQRRAIEGMVQPNTVHVVWFEYAPRPEPVDRPVLGFAR